MQRWIVIMWTLAATVAGSMSGTTSAAEELKGTLTCSGAWALYPMTVRWAQEFRKLHPRVNVDVSAGGAGKGITDALAGVVDIGLVSREIHAVEIEKGAFAVAVTRDAVVAVVNERNPAIAQLRRLGVKREMLAGIWMKKDVTSWGQVAGTADKAPIRVYRRSDACGAAETWAKYLGGSKQDDLSGVGVYGDPGLAEAVRRDTLGIGFNNVNFAYDAKTGKPVAGLAVLPIDVNSNGVLDEAESFYASQKDLVAAISRGDYPSPPARDLYFVTRGRPAALLPVAFIRWVLTDGQAFVAESGYIGLGAAQLEKGLKALEEGR